MSSEDRQFKGVAPYFMVRNLQQSLDYYHRAFGFKMLKLWGEPPTFAMPPKQEEPEDIIAPSRYQGGFWDVYSLDQRRPVRGMQGQRRCDRIRALHSG